VAVGFTNRCHTPWWFLPCLWGFARRAAWSTDRGASDSRTHAMSNPAPGLAWSPPSSSTQRVVFLTTLLMAVSRITLAPLWLARPAGGGSHRPALSGELQTPLYLKSSVCPRSHLFTPYRAPIRGALDRRTSWRTPHFEMVSHRRGAGRHDWRVLGRRQRHESRDRFHVLVP
jgi:hypothetical protein